jgi:hypothetical protein
MTGNAICPERAAHRILPPTGFHHLPDWEHHDLRVLKGRPTTNGQNGDILTAIEEPIAPMGAIFLRKAHEEPRGFCNILPRGQPIYFCPTGTIFDPRPVTVAWMFGYGPYFDEAISLQSAVYPTCPTCHGGGTTWNVSSIPSTKRGGCHDCWRARLVFSFKWLLIGQSRDPSRTIPHWPAWGAQTREEIRKRKRRYNKDNEFATYRIIKSTEYQGMAF